MNTIDSHLHVWDLSRAAYSWLGPHLAPIDVSLGFDNVREDLRACEVTGVVLVQAADNAEDTRNMFAVADSVPQVVGVVAWAPLDDPDQTARRINILRAHPKFAGIRVLIHDLPDPDWIVRPGPDAGLGVLAAHGVPYDYVTANPTALRHVPGICQRHPDLRLVIDHLGKPPVGEPLDEWRELLARAAEHSTVYAKVSGLYPAIADQLRPILMTALEVFGPDRLMLGSDWPVSVLSGGYQQVWGELSRLVDELAPAEREALRGGTATAFYRLKERAQ